MIDTRRRKDRNSPRRDRASDRDIVQKHTGRVLSHKAFDEVGSDSEPGARCKPNPLVLSYNATIESRPRETCTKLEIQRDVHKGGEVRSEDIRIAREARGEKPKGPHLLLIESVERLFASNKHGIPIDEIRLDVRMGLVEHNIHTRMGGTPPRRLERSIDRVCVTRKDKNENSEGVHIYM
jgi:hypothetical protein